MIFKSPRFVAFRAILTNFGANIATKPLKKAKKDTRKTNNSVTFKDKNSKKFAHVYKNLNP